ncbi:gallinacin-10-like [Malaclemys terrapin pileata]|uniref:gallinacin-10-like n=1 Tax=Malaclemys terrapin pileata TaxID=2991368 RepID=UPI0023A8A4A0|nr:gallinacin-10-like [Malaclemys terrapin pileata]
MRIFYLLFAVLVFLFQATPGVADVGPPPADTLACKAQGGFCRLLNCPPVFSVSGTCHGGQLQCCTRIPRA